MFCSEINETSGEQISQCDNSLYRKSPSKADLKSLTVSKVYPGPNCKPEAAYTDEFAFSRPGDRINQEGPEACKSKRGCSHSELQVLTIHTGNCRDRGIRLAINKGNENINSSEAHAFQHGSPGQTFSLPTQTKSPCSFRSASFAW